MTWDRFDGIDPPIRTTIIKAAYRQVLDSSRLTSATGLTFPEAYADGRLPYRLFYHLRPGDPVTADECDRAMLDAGASTLFPGVKPELRFGCADDAFSALGRLQVVLPAGMMVWHVLKIV